MNKNDSNNKKHIFFTENFGTVMQQLILKSRIEENLLLIFDVITCVFCPRLPPLHPLFSVGRAGSKTLILCYYSAPCGLHSTGDT